MYLFLEQIKLDLIKIWANLLGPMVAELELTLNVFLK